MQVKGLDRGRAHFVEVDGGPSLRAQFKANEKSLVATEHGQLAAIAPEQRVALKAEFTQKRAARARRYATMLCSVEGWQPKPGARPESKILTGFYGLVGERARALAKSEGKPFAMEHVERVRLSKGDVVALREQYGDAAVKKAWPMLQKHIAHDDFLDQGALLYMQSSDFLVFHAALRQTLDAVERNIAAHAEKLSANDAGLLREHGKDVERRRLIKWTGPVVVERGHQADPLTGADKVSTQKYASVGGHLVPIDHDDE